MAITNLQTLSAVSVDTDFTSGDSTSAVITGIRNSRVNPNINFVREVTTGQAWAHFGAIYAASPAASFSTIDVARCGALIGLQGLSMLTTGATGVKFFGIKKQKGGVRVSDAEHVCFTAIDGMMVLRSISAGHQSDAVMEVETMATSANGATAPLVETSNAALPTIPDDTHRFTLGPVTLGSSSGDLITLIQKTSVEIDFRPTLEVFGSDSDIYPSIANLTMVEPILRISTLDVTTLTSVIPLSGKPINLSYSAFFLRKRSKSSGTGFVANATAEHIKFTPYDGCAYQASVFEAQSPAGNAMAVIEIPLIGLGANFPLAVSWASAIS